MGCAVRFALVWLLVVFSGQLAGAARPGLKHVDLQEARLSAGYKLLLDTAYKRLMTWCVVNSEGTPEDLSSDAIKMSDMLTRHVQYLFENKHGVSAGRQAILCVQLRYRHLRTSLAKAWDSIKSWEQINPISMRVPLPWLVVDAEGARTFTPPSGQLGTPLEARKMRHSCACEPCPMLKEMSPP